MTMPDGWIRRLGSYCWKQRHHFVTALAGALTASLAASAVPLIQRWIIDDVVVARRQGIWAAIVVLLATGALAFGGMSLRRYFSWKAALNIQHELRVGVLKAVFRLDGASADKINMGQLVSRTTSDLNMVQQLVAMLPVAFGNLVLVLIMTGVMLTLSPILTLVAAASVPAIWFIALRSSKRLFPASWHASHETGEVASVAAANIAGARIVKSFGQERRELSRFEQACTKVFGSRLRMIRLTARYNSALVSIPPLSLVGVLCLGGWLAVHHQITLGTFLAFSTYLALLMDPIQMLTYTVSIGQEARASVMRIWDTIDSSPQITDIGDAEDLAAHAGRVSLANVHFGYLPGHEVLRGLTLCAGPGETVAIVGASGCGKSTIGRLLLRFYEPDSGTVSVGHQDIRKIALASLRGAVGLVSEDSAIFSGTVRSNICYGRPDATDEEIVSAAKTAQAHDFIVQLAAGYETAVGERGLNLSGGQRQRIALARALLADTPVLILDDATSAVDSATEAAIYAGLRQNRAGQTTLLIAQCRSALSVADRIVVLENGMVLDEGTNAELIARCQRYRHLVTEPAREIEDLALTVPETSAGALGAARLAASPDIGRLSRSSPPPAVPTGELRDAIAALPAVRDKPRGSDPNGIFADLARGFSMRRLARPLTGALAAALLLDGLFAVATLAVPALVRDAIDRGVEQGAFGVVLRTSVAGLIIAVGGWSAYAAEILVVGRLSEQLMYKLRLLAFAQLQRLGLDFYDREPAGQILTRLTTDIDAMATFMQTGLVTMVTALLTVLGVLAALLVINVEVGLAVFAVIPIVVAATLLFRIKSSRAYSGARDKVATVNAAFAENVAGLRTLQACNREKLELARFAVLSDTYRRARINAQRYGVFFFPFIQALSIASNAIVLIVASRKVHDGTLSAGALIAYLLYVDIVFNPVQQLAQVFDGYQQARVGVNRIVDLLQLDSSIPMSLGQRGSSRAARAWPEGRLKGQIEFRDVSFEYQGTVGRRVLSGVNLVISPGETVALVGQTGAGKSTMVKLISRFYDPVAGILLIDDTDLRRADVTAYRRQLGVVPQENYLFAGTVGDAIAYGRPESSDEEVQAAARAVGVHEAVLSLPGGYAHSVAEGGQNLSAGQRQLIALARAELVDPAILLLDEATAALDHETEAVVNRAMFRVAKTRTTVIIAHRLTTAVEADRIVVMSNGRIVEQGTHEQLLAARGSYSALWNAFTDIGKGAGSQERRR